MVEFVSSNFLRLTIATKLMLGFSALLTLLVIISVYALTNLNRLNSINYSIIQTDLPVILASEKMIDILLAEELYLRRHMVFQTADVLDIFLSKKEEFKAQLYRISTVPERRDFPVKKSSFCTSSMLNFCLKEQILSARLRHQCLSSTKKKSKLIRTILLLSLRQWPQMHNWIKTIRPV
ncbi:MAG TPA: hypothetical protein EYG51_25195 [Pseudomonadales bacterium]|nr:hypothetical protein [Pseudomonadales bacterium]